MMETKVGACGICCSTCGLYTQGICEGCIKTEKQVKRLQEMDANCPVLECAVNKGIEVCSRDCSQFPCDNFQDWPLAQSWLEMFEERSEK